MSLLSVKNLSVSFYTREGVTRAVDQVSFELEEGKILGIVGESGSGKSVCCYTLLGLIPMPPGQIENGTAIYGGNDLLKLEEKAMRRVRGREIAMIFQDPMTSLNPYLTIGAQLVEALNLHSRVSRKQAKEKVISLLDEVGIRDAAQRFDAYPHEFSGGMRQRVMIAMALVAEPKILIADEPTTALDVTVQAQVLDLISSLQASRNLSVIFISHDLAVVNKLADDVLVMRRGQVVETGLAQNVFSQPKHEYTRSLLNAIPQETKTENSNQKGAQTADILLRIESLSVIYQRFDASFVKRLFAKPQEVEVLNNISLDLKRGEILGLVGESGSGKSTLGKAIVNLVPTASGRIIFDDLTLSIARNQAERKIATGIQLIFQDPYASLNPRKTVFDTLAEPLLKLGQATKQNLNDAVNHLMDDVGLERGYIRRYPHEFSGGQRQRIAIARALAARPKLIIADEPVSALDVTVQAQILKLLTHLSEKYQLSILFISHDLAVVRAIADRVLVMQAGMLVEEGSTHHIFNRPQHVYTKALLQAIP